MIHLFDFYQTEGRQKLQKQLGIANPMAVPRLLKVVVNCGVGEALTNKKAIEEVEKQMTAIVGQKPVVTAAKHDISTFKLRKGDKVGVKVTLRGRKMYDFVDKLIRIVLPRIRDFRGVSSTAFDAQGNFTLGLAEQVVFLEIEYSQIDKIRGLEMTFVTTARNPEESKQLLELLGMPFEKGKSVQR